MRASRSRERAIVALAGDFGVQFTLQELMTAVELEVTLPVVVWNNDALGRSATTCAPRASPRSG